jgi:hypothetical protein
MKTNLIRSMLAVSIVALVLTNCGLLSRRVKPGEEFTLKPRETVVVSGAGLEIKLEEVGHQTFPNPQPQPLRSAYVQLVVTTDGPPRSIRVDESVEVGEYTITVKSANPFRYNDGPRATLVVTRR